MLSCRDAMCVLTKSVLRRYLASVNACLDGRGEIVRISAPMTTWFDGTVSCTLFALGPLWLISDFSDLSDEKRSDGARGSKLRGMAYVSVQQDVGRSMALSADVPTLIVWGRAKSPTCMSMRRIYKRRTTSYQGRFQIRASTSDRSNGRPDS